jgi:hypothetical protein
MDDATGSLRPQERSDYTLTLNADGTAALQLDCNRASGTWTAEPAADTVSGNFQFGPLATTLAACPPPSIGEQVASQLQWVRGYLIRDGRLNLSLMADGGILVGEPAAIEEPFETDPDPGLEAAIRDEGDDVGYRHVQTFAISRPPVIVSPDRSQGWNDLVRLESGGGAKATYLRHHFDGERYVEGERTEAGTTPPEGQRLLGGELTFDVGIPLEPTR